MSQPDRSDFARQVATIGAGYASVIKAAANPEGWQYGADRQRIGNLREWWDTPGDGYQQWAREELKALGEDGLRRLFEGDDLEVEEFELWLGRWMELNPE